MNLLEGVLRARHQGKDLDVASTGSPVPLLDHAPGRICVCVFPAGRSIRKPDGQTHPGHSHRV